MSSSERPPGDDDERDDDPLAFVPDERDQAEAAGDPPTGASSLDPATLVGPPERPSFAPEDDDRGRAAAVARAVGGRWVAVIVVLAAVIGGVSLLTAGGGGESRGTVKTGSKLPPFAAPLATAPKLKSDDVNLAAKPNQGQAGSVAACSIVNPSVVTSCGLLRRGPLVLAMFSSGVGECVGTVDEIDRLRARFPRIQTLAVAIGGEHGSTAKTVRARRWRLPVAYDRDGALSSRLGVAVCPFVLFVESDGRIAERLIGTPAPGALARGMAALAAPAPTGDAGSPTPASGR